MSAPTDPPGAFKRLWAYVKGGQTGGEGYFEGSDPLPAPWVEQARDNAELAVYALESAKRSAGFASDAVAAIQVRAERLIPITLTLLTASIAGTGLALSRVTWWTAGVVFLLVDTALVASCTASFLCTGSVVGIGVNLGRLSKDIPRPALASVQVEEALTWHESAWVAMEVGTLKARELFVARRLLVFALIGAILGSVLLGFTHPRIPPVAVRFPSAQSPSMPAQEGTSAVATGIRPSEGTDLVPGFAALVVALATVYLAFSTRKVADQTRNAAEATVQEAKSSATQAKLLEQQIRVARLSVDSSIRPWISRVTPPLAASFSADKTPSEHEVVLRSISNNRLKIRMHIRNVGKGVALIEASPEFRIQGWGAGGEEITRRAFASNAALPPGEASMLSFIVEGTSSEQFLHRANNDGEFFVWIPYSDINGRQTTVARMHVVRYSRTGPWGIFRIHYFTPDSEEAFATIEFDAAVANYEGRFPDEDKPVDLS